MVRKFQEKYYYRTHAHITNRGLVQQNDDLWSDLVIIWFWIQHLYMSYMKMNFVAIYCTLHYCIYLLLLKKRTTIWSKTFYCQYSEIINASVPCKANPWRINKLSYHLSFTTQLDFIICFFSNFLVISVDPRFDMQ